MSLFIAWVAFPLVLALLSLGCGLLLESISGVDLPGVLVLPVGFAMIVVAIEFATMTSATASLSSPLVVALAVAGLALSVPWRREAVDGYAAAAAVAVFAAFAAPVVLSGEATLAGYIKLDDTATWLALTDRMLDQGRSLAGLAPSSYFAVLQDDLPQGYPVGSLLPLGAGHALIGQDAAWLFQPYLAFLGSMLALALYSLASSLVRSPTLRFLAAFVAGQPALLYGYALWGGVKEIAAAALLATLTGLLTPLLRARGPVRSAIPLAVTSAAVLGALSLGGIAWLAPILLPALLLIALTHGRAPAVRRTAAYMGFTAVLALPVLATGFVFIGQATGASDLTRKNVLGNLFHPLSKLQFFGIWPTGDFRLSPARLDVTHLLILALVVAAVAGVFFAWQHGAAVLLIYVAGLAIGAALFVAFASPWVSAKALATASSAPLLLGMSGAAAVFERGRRVEAVLLAAAITGGVLWSNALAYHDVTLAPRAQLVELERIGEQFAGQGPTLLNDYSPYGVRHFLRNVDAEGPAERRIRPIPLRNGALVQPGTTADLDEFQLEPLLLYRTIVLRRSATASRPPSIYRLVWAGRYYEVWQRPSPTPSPILEHLSLGSRYQPAATPNCADVQRLAGIAGSGGTLATVERPPVTTVELSPTAYPAGLERDGEDRRVLYLRRRTTLAVEARLPASGRYDVWLGGTFLARLSLSVDGKLLATRRHELNWPGQYTPMGDVALTAGLHRITLSYGGPDLHPGSAGDPPFGAGPVVLGRGTADRPMTYVLASRWRSLCGKRLDWVEALRG